MQLLVNQLLPFSNVEGIGNRTAIFLQGCNVRCVYCHNPETIPEQSKMAKLYDVEALAKQVIGYKAFTRGITVSGGEPTLQYEALIELFNKVRPSGLTCYLDSNGFFDFEEIAELIKVTDKFLYDIKGSGQGLQSLCFEREREFGKAKLAKATAAYTGESVSENIQFQNLRRLLELDKVEEVRIVCIKGFYDLPQLVKDTARFIKDYPEVLLKLIRVHVRGSGAGRSKAFTDRIPTPAEMNDLEKLAKQNGVAKTLVIL